MSEPPTTLDVSFQTPRYGPDAKPDPEAALLAQMLAAAEQCEETARRKRKRRKRVPEAPDET